MEAVVYLRWTLGCSFLILAAWLAVLNWGVVYQTRMFQRPGPSWVPLAAGGLGAIGLANIPIPEVSRWWWLCFFLDFGSIPGLSYTLIWHGARLWRERREK